MLGFISLIGSVLALAAFLVACAWIFTPKRQPARRSRRGWGAIFLFAASALAHVLAGNLS